MQLQAWNDASLQFIADAAGTANAGNRYGGLCHLQINSTRKKLSAPLEAIHPSASRPPSARPRTVAVSHSADP